MPILRVEVVLRANERLSPDLARILADEAAAVFESPPGETWVRITPLASEHYAENATDSNEGPYPVFVTIVRYELPSKAVLTKEARDLAQRFAPHFTRPVEDIHLHFLPDGRGHVALGGELVA